jgi:hypothetical protein
MSTKDELQAALKAARPHLSQSSLTTYASVLGSALRALDITLADVTANADRLVAHALAKTSMQSAKSLLSTLVVLTGLDVFKQPMGELMAQLKETATTQQTSAHRADIDLSWPDVVARAAASDALIRRSPTNKNLVENLVYHLALGIDHPPRRLEIASLKVRNYDEAKDNYLQGSTLVYNNYKTARKYGQMRISVLPKTMKTVRRLMKQQDSDYLLTTVTGKPMSNSVLSHRIGAVMGNPKIGIDVIRSTFITHVFRGAPTLKDAESLATAMGNSVAAQQLFYRKID